MVVGKLSIRDFVSPGTRVGPTEDPKMCLNLLVDMFCFAVRLGVIGGGKGEVIVEEFAKLLGKGGCELGTTIRDDFIIESEA